MSPYVSYSDQELLRMLSAGDRIAFDAFYERWRVQCIDAAYQRLKDREAAEDIVQNLFVQLWMKRSNLQIDNVQGYLHRGVRNGVINYVTREKKPLTNHFGEPFEAMLMETESPDARLLEKDLMALILRYSKTLNPRPREIFLLHVQQKLSTKEIAEKLGVSQKAVQNQLRTALVTLQEQIGPALFLIIMLNCNSNLIII